jgi:GNAT superfamily N-acetyltransferase
MRIAAKIRRAVPLDAEEVSRVIFRALRETNTRDYPPHIMTTVAENFSPERVAEKLRMWQAYVTIVYGVVVGTASLDGHVIRGVYVDPIYQGKGTGARLMDVLEGFAREEGVTTLRVPPSITAESFYRKRGFVFARDEFYGDEKMIIMEKDIRNAS